jgi:hypothetical protein
MQVRVRMPTAFHRKLMRDAERSGQTLNAEILRRLEESYETDDRIKRLSGRLDTIDEVKRGIEELKKSLAERLDRKEI